MLRTSRLGSRKIALNISCDVKNLRIENNEETQQSSLNNFTNYKVFEESQLHIRQLKCVKSLSTAQ